MEISNLGRLFRFWSVISFLLTSACVSAQSFKVTQVRVRLFFQYSGELSTPLTGKEDLWNIMAGGGEFAEPVNSAFVDVTVFGAQKNHAAQQVVNFLVTNKRTGRIIQRQKEKTGIFSPSGENHVGFWLRSVSCDPLIVFVSTADSSKSQTLPLRCGE